jgi:hypothetical protein
MPHPTPPRQLPLPLTLPRPTGALLPLRGTLVPSHAVWASLSSPDQARFRRTLITLLQEATRVRDAC